MQETAFGKSKAGNLYETTVLLYLFVVPIVDYRAIPFH